MYIDQHTVREARTFGWLITKAQIWHEYCVGGIAGAGLGKQLERGMCENN